MSGIRKEDIRAALARRRQEGNFRSCSCVQRRSGAHIWVDGREYINFSSNDYLGMAASAVLEEAWRRGLEIWGAGSGASPLVTGMSDIHRELAAWIADFLDMEAVLLFSSGFAANQAVIKTFCGSDTVFYMDRLAHASLQDAAMHSKGRLLRFTHNSPESLERYMRKYGPGLVVTEGVFSMDGDQPPLAEILEVAERYGSDVMLDDAHGFGVLGEQGRGTVNAQNLTHDRFAIVTGTFGKAYGTGGAFVATSAENAAYMENFAREYIYSTFMPPAQAYATLRSMQYVAEEPFMRELVGHHVQSFRRQLKDTSFTLLPSEVSIQPLIVGESEKALELSEFLKTRGFWASAIRPPTVPKGTARIRFTLTAGHKYVEIDALCMTLIEWDLCHKAERRS